MTHSNTFLTSHKNLSDDFKHIANDVFSGKRISIDQGVKLFDADISFLGSLANYVREKKA